MGGAKFFRTVNLNFPKEDHKNSFYTKNHPNSMNRLGDINYNGNSTATVASFDFRHSSTNDETRRHVLTNDETRSSYFDE